jgi:hypothetical protein
MMHASASAGASALSAGVGASFAVSASGARLKEKIVEFYESIFVKVPRAHSTAFIFQNKEEEGNSNERGGVKY